MATQRRKDAPLKEKIGTAPNPTKTKKSSSTNTNPTLEQKQIPSYLKPTISSSGLIDHPHSTPKKQGISSTKPNINRRRSFDKAPSLSSSTIHNKSLHTSLRSPSPVLSKVNSLPKPHTKKIIQPSSSTRANTSIKKTNTLISGTIKEETNGKQSEQVPTEVGNCIKEDEAISENEIKEEVKAIVINNNKFVDYEARIGETPSICENVKRCNLDDKKECAVSFEIEGVGENVFVDEVVIENHDEKEEEENDIENEGMKEDAEEGDEKEKEEDRTEIPIEEVLEGNDDVVKNGENSEILSKEEEVKEGINKEGKDRNGEQVNKEVGNASGKEAQQQVPYNDVIEETKNKLLEKRKNKVKALVGAFETVISLQEPDT